MSSKAEIASALQEFEPNQIFFASSLYQGKLSDSISEAAYYKALERMVKTDTLKKAARGVYYIPLKSKFGLVPPSEKDVVEAFTKDETGTVIGYALYNSLKLTTQVSRQTEVLTSCLKQHSKRIGNVFLTQCSLTFNEKNRIIISAMDVLRNYSRIQEMAPQSFLSFCQKVAAEYDDSAFASVQEKLHYSKSAIAFLKSVLDCYSTPNSLNKYLSKMSIYKYPRIEELFAIPSTRKQNDGFKSFPSCTQNPPNLNQTN